MEILTLEVDWQKFHVEFLTLEADCQEFYVEILTPEADCQKFHVDFLPPRSVGKNSMWIFYPRGQLVRIPCGFFTPEADW